MTKRWIANSLNSLRFKLNLIKSRIITANKISSVGITPPKTIGYNDPLTRTEVNMMNLKSQFFIIN